MKKKVSEKKVQEIADSYKDLSQAQLAELMKIKIQKDNVTKESLTGVMKATVPKLEETASNLAGGRRKGAESQKEYAEESLNLMLQINSDLLKNSDAARWDLDRRAGYIAEKLSEKGRRQPNGNPYKASTIKNKITGKG